MKVSKMKAQRLTKIGSLIVTGIVLASSLVVRAQADVSIQKNEPQQIEVQQDADEVVETKIPGAMILESRLRTSVTINGWEVKSLVQLQKIFKSILKQGKASGLELRDLTQAVQSFVNPVNVGTSNVNPSNELSKELEVTIVDGASLSLAIGEENLQKLLDVLNDVQDANPMQFRVVYWQ